MPVLKNQRHELFSQGLVKGLPASKAYEEAGYVPNEANACRLTRNDKIQARVAELQSRAATRVEVDRAWVLEKLKENAERALQATPVYDREGNETGEYQYQGNVANRALELIGKAVEPGMFTDKMQIEGQIDLGAVLERARRAKRKADG